MNTISELKKEAKELGVKFGANIGEDTLAARIAAHKSAIASDDDDEPKELPEDEAMPVEDDDKVVVDKFSDDDELAGLPGNDEHADNTPVPTISVRVNKAVNMAARTGKLPPHPKGFILTGKGSHINAECQKCEHSHRYGEYAKCPGCGATVTVGK